MKIKSSPQRWMTVALTMVLLITSLISFAVPIAASDPPNVYGTIVIPNPWNPGTQGTFFDVKVNNGGALSAWCVEEHINISVAQPYNTQIIDYFGVYYPTYTGLLPAKIQSLPWSKIAYIINNKIGTYKDVQQAIWYFTEGGNYSNYFSGLNQANIDAMVAGANSNSGYVPGTGEVRPIIYYVNDTTQIVISEYPNDPYVPPVPELPSGILFSAGLLGIVGFIIAKRHSVAITD